LPPAPSSSRSPKLAIGLIYPPTGDILGVSLGTAECIFDHGLDGVPRPDDIAHLRARAYKPVYAAKV
jgi:hypothetical protein